MSDTTTDLRGARVVLAGGGSGIGRALAADLVGAGAEVVLTGRDLGRARAAAAAIDPRVRAARIDLQDEATIAAAAEELGDVAHVVSLASEHAQGPVAGLDRAAITAAFDAKAIGPILLAKHFAGRLAPGGAFVVFSGVAAWRPSPGGAVTAATNGAVAALVGALAVELAPLRAVAIAPGVVDSGAWDGARKAALFAETAKTLPARRVGEPADISAAVLLALTNTFLTGTTLHVDGGGSVL